MKSGKIGFAALLRVLLLTTLALPALERAAAPDPSARLASRDPEAGAGLLAAAHLPRGEATAEAGSCAAGSGILELVGAPKRAQRSHATRTGLVPCRWLDGEPSRIRAVGRTRAGFAHALAEASAGTATQATTLPPPHLA